MTIATEMKELTRNIASSHADRMSRISEIREEANQTRGEAGSLIKSFGASRKETGRQLRRELAGDKAHRKSEAMAIIGEAQNILRGFETSRKEANAKLRKDLSRGTAERRSEVRETLEDAQQTIKGFQSKRKKTGTQLRGDLAQGEAERKSDVNGMLMGFQNLRREGGTQMRKELAQATAGRRSEVKEMQSDFRKARADVRADLKEAGAAWQELASTGRAKRARVEVSPKAAVAEAPVAEEESPDLETKLLTAVDEHPEGITLSEVADSLGVAPIVLGRASKSLLEKGKVRKEERLYFPVAE